MQSAAKQPKTGFDFPYLIKEWKDMFKPDTLVPDIWAGITVALVALPLNLALAIAAGVDPGVGITTGVIAGIIGSLFGGQRFAVTGPAAAMAVVLIEISQVYGIQGIWVVGIIAGILQILAGLFKCGKIISYIPMPVMVGFANAIGTLIAFNAVDDFLGLSPTPLAHPGSPPPLQGHPLIPEFIEDISALLWRVIMHGEFNLYAIGIGVVTFAIAALMPRLTKAVPGQLVAIVVGTGIASAMNLHLPRIHDISIIPNYLPWPSIPNIPWQDIDTLFASAITVFMLGSIESLLSASVADGMTMSQRHKTDQELIGQGMANIIVPFFGGIPVTGVIARTAINIRAGAKTRLSGIIHSLTLMMLIFFLAKYAQEIPLAALAAILVLTGIRLIEWDEVQTIWRTSRTESGIMAATTLVSVMVDLTAGVVAGLLFTCGLFVRKMSAVRITSTNGENGDSIDLISDLPACHLVQTYVIDGPLFFGAAERFIDNILLVKDVKVVILHMRAASVIDVTGITTLRSIKKQLDRIHGRLIIAELPAEPLAMLEKSGALKQLGEDNIFKTYKDALLEANISMLKTACHGSSPTIAKLLDIPPSGQHHKKCRLQTALASDSSPAYTLIANKLADKPKRRASDNPDLLRLYTVINDAQIPPALQNTPIAELLKSHNLGEIDATASDQPQLIIGMCIDYRKSLLLKRDWAFVVRREGANMLGAEFALALATSFGIKYMALVAHDNCAMTNTQNIRDNFIDMLTNNHGWNADVARHFFDDHIRTCKINNEIDFIVEEAHRLETTFKALTVVPMLYRVEDDKLYLIKDWLDNNKIEYNDEQEPVHQLSQ